MNHFFYNEEQVDLSQLEYRFSTLEKWKRIVVRVDEAVAFQTFQTVLDLLKRHDLERLSIFTRQ